jgi:tight adherence protein B
MPDHVLVAAFLSAGATFLALWTVALRMLGRQRSRFERSVGRSLREAFLFIDPASLHRLSWLMAVICTGLALVLSGSPILALLVALAVGAVPGAAIGRMRRRRLEAFRQQIPDLLMLVAGALRAGNGLAQALAGAAAEIAPPARQELALVLREQRLGASLVDSLAGMQRRLAVEETVLFSAALRIGSEAGGNVAEALESLADATRRKLAIEGKIRALTAQGRMQAWVMAMLPAALAAALGLIDPDAMRPLFEDWRGWIVCAVVFTMQLAGFLMIRRLVGIEI